MAYQRAIMDGVRSSMPSRYPAEVMLAEEHNWSYTQVHAQPADYIDELLTRIIARRKWEGERDQRDSSRKRQEAARTAGKKYGR